MALSLKISNVHEYPLDLLKRLRGVQSPGKKKLLDGIKTGNWKDVYSELLFRIELYTNAKVLNYTRQDLKSIVINSQKVGIPSLVEALYQKNFVNNINKVETEVPNEPIKKTFNDLIKSISKELLDMNITNSFESEIEFNNVGISMPEFRSAVYRTLKAIKSGSGRQILKSGFSTTAEYENIHISLYDITEDIIQLYNIRDENKQSALQIAIINIIEDTTGLLNEPGYREYVGAEINE